MSNEAVQNIVDEPFEDILSERYLSYALSTIMSRSLPDVRDGLKPVHRRLLYAMHQLSLKSTTSPKKSARVVGDVIGKFHPHGDQSVYDALVRLAQDFSVRYPLIDGQGNFGNVDGDNAAAMRYTEARLTRVAELLLEGLDEDAVDFRETYDGEGREPVVMPAGFPNLLANGASGIAVGMATNVPPHNVAELCAAMIAMIDGDPDDAEIAGLVTGPDFPTGGVLVEDAQTIAEAYATGKGSLRVRAKWEKEELKQGQYQIIVTEIPYQVQKSRLVEKIADLITTRKVPMLEDVRDESAEDIRLVLVPKSRNVEPEILMEALFRNCDLENRFSMNMNVLEEGKRPQVLSLKKILQNFLTHRQEVLVRRSNHRLEKVLARIEVLEGYLVVYLNIDEVIRIIRESDEPKPELMQAFGLSEAQAEAVLNMRLRSLRKLEEIEIKSEHSALSKERDQLQALIKSEARQWTQVKRQIEALGKEFGEETELGRRRTRIASAPKLIDVPDDAMIEKEPITVICSQQGWIRAMKGHAVKPADVKYKEGDAEDYIFPAQTTDKILVFASNGRFYTLGGDKLPAGRGYGEPIRLSVDLPAEDSIIAMFICAAEQKLLVAAETGHGFITKAGDVIAQTKNGKQVLNGKAALCRMIGEGDDHLAVIGSNRKMLAFPLADIPEMGRGKGVILQKYKGAKIADAKSFALETGLEFPYGGGVRLEQDMSPWLAKRATMGKLPPNGFPKSNRF